MSPTASPPVAVIGAAGFIGSALIARLASRGTPVIAVARREPGHAPRAGVVWRAVGDMTADAIDWTGLVAGARAVVHLASRAQAPPGEPGWIERDAALAARLGRGATAAGVEQLLLMSSIKVLGPPRDGAAFRSGQSAAPADAYGFAKWSIEEALRAATAGGPALIVLRPPLVHGPGVKANFLSLMRLVDRALPLPLASVANRRSLVAIDNLIDLIEIALDQPAARHGTFLLRDDEEPSTPALIRAIARALARPARLFPCPPSLLRLGLAAIGRSDDAERLLGSLTIDDSDTRQRLGWRPRMTLEDGLAATGRWYRSGAWRP
jgi:nucleoside-diphosphate-sugar epimerase